MGFSSRRARPPTTLERFVLQDAETSLDAAGTGLLPKNAAGVPQDWASRSSGARTAMLIRIGYDLIFDVPAPTVMLLMLRVHPSREPSLRAPERIRIDPGVPVQELTDGFGNRCGRLLAPAGRLRIRNDAIVQD